MKKFFCLLILASGLASGRSVQAQTMPPLPPPQPPITIPNCPFQLMGQINGIYYWHLRNCPHNGNSGYAQTLSNLVTPCCNEMTGACSCGVSVVMSAPAAGEAAAQTQQAEQKYAQPISEVSIVASPACDLPHGTEAEAITKLEAIIVELQANEAHLKNLAASSEVQNSDVKNQKGRVKSWLNTVSKMLNYLINGSDAATVKITNYCDNFLPADSAHKHAWRHATFPLLDGKLQQISNEQQKRPLLPAASVNVVDKPGTVTVRRFPVIRVNVANLSTPDKKVYFQTFEVSHKPQGETESLFYVGVQVEEPVTGGFTNAVFKDRHNYGHKIRTPSGTTFLVSSHDDLGISK